MISSLKNTKFVPWLNTIPFDSFYLLRGSDSSGWAEDIGISLSPGDGLQCGLAVNLSGSLSGGGRWVGGRAGVRTVSASQVMWLESHLLTPGLHCPLLKGTDHSFPASEEITYFQE